MLIYIAVQYIKKKPLHYNLAKKVSDFIKTNMLTFSVILLKLKNNIIWNWTSKFEYLLSQRKKTKIYRIN